MEPIPDHKPLPEGQWWACDRPEAMPEAFRVHYRPKCRRCLPAFLASAVQPHATFYLPESDRPTALCAKNASTIPELTEWFMRESLDTASQND